MQYLIIEFDQWDGEFIYCHDGDPVAPGDRVEVRVRHEFIIRPISAIAPRPRYSVNSIVRIIDRKPPPPADPALGDLFNA